MSMSYKPFWAAFAYVACTSVLAAPSTAEAQRRDRGQVNFLAAADQDVRSVNFASALSAAAGVLIIPLHSVSDLDAASEILSSEERAALGRALAATGKVTRGIGELETAAGLAPQIPEIHLALARAYARAGRKADADRANAVFRTLDEARRKGAP